MIKVIDNVISEKFLEKAIEKAETSKNYSLLHGAGASQNQFKYNWMLFDEMNDVDFIDQDFLNLWTDVKKNVPENTVLRRAYINAHTYGVEDTIHTDDKQYSKGFTVIVYLCNDWYAQWGGTTNMYEGNAPNKLEVISSTVPRRNRILIFDKNIPHMVTPLSRLFTGVRLTCMFKLESVKE